MRPFLRGSYNRGDDIKNHDSGRSRTVSTRAREAEATAHPDSSPGLAVLSVVASKIQTWSHLASASRARSRACAASHLRRRGSDAGKRALSERRPPAETARPAHLNVELGLDAGGVVTRPKGRKVLKAHTNRCWGHLRPCRARATSSRLIRFTLIEPDMKISRIRLSDKTSRLHPRHVVPKPAQAHEPEVPVKVFPQFKQWYLTGTGIMPS
jgi:hypothetical protein